MGGTSTRPEKIKGCIEEINRQRNTFLDELETADGRLEQELGVTSDGTTSDSEEIGSRDEQSQQPELRSLKEAS